MTATFPGIKTSLLADAFVQSGLKLVADAFVSDGHRAVHQQTSTTNRVTLDYGYSFPAMRQGHLERHIPPQALTMLYNEIAARLKADHPDLAIADNFDNCIISTFSQGHKVELHVDANDAQKNRERGGLAFEFGDVIIGVVLRADTRGRLYFQHSEDGKPEFDPEKAIYINEEDGLIYCMQGDVRHEPWYHGVSDIADERISLTFRTVRFTEDVETANAHFTR